VPEVTEPSLAGGVVEVVAARRRTFGTPLIDFVDEVVVDDSLRLCSFSLFFTLCAPRFWSNETWCGLNATILIVSGGGTTYFREDPLRVEVLDPLLREVW
jgi:hypothetical protein